MDCVGDNWSGFATHDNSAYHELWDNCVGAWAPLIGPSGLTLHDLSGYGKNGTLTNMAPASDWVSATSGGTVLDFDAIDDHIVLSYKALTLPFSVTTWAMCRQSTAINYPFGIGNSADTKPLFVIGFRGDLSGDPVVCQMRGNNDAINTTANSATGYTVNRWHAITAVFRSTTYRQIYLDGVPGTADTTAHTFETCDRMTIGALTRTTTSNYLNGQIASVELHAGELSESDIRTHAMRIGIAYERRPRRRRAGVTAAAATRRHLMLLGVGR